MVKFFKSMQFKFVFVMNHNKTTKTIMCENRLLLFNFQISSKFELENMPNNVFNM